MGERAALNKAIHPWSYRYTFDVTCNYYYDRNVFIVAAINIAGGNEFYADATYSPRNRADEKQLSSL